MIDTPHLAESAEQLMAFVHLTVPREDIRHVMGPGLAEVRAALAEQGVAAVGPWWTHHRRMEPAQFDFEICVPVASPIAAVGRVQPGRRPARRVARTVYTGPYEGLADAWGEFMAWIVAEGHTPADDLWEVYVAGPESSPDPAAWRTELNRPLVGQY